MTSLMEILEGLDIKIEDDDKDDKNDKIDTKNIDINKIPEDQRPVVQALMNENNNLSNEVSKINLKFDTLANSTKELLQNIGKGNISDTKDDKDTKDDNKILGVLDKDDQYAPVFLALSKSINEIKDSVNSVSLKDQQNQDNTWKNNVISFAKTNKDVVKYAQTMDKIRSQINPESPLFNNVEYLYNSAKIMQDSDESKINDVKDKHGNVINANKHFSERSGMSTSNVQNISGNSKSIAEAFEASEEQLARK